MVVEVAAYVPIHGRGIELGPRARETTTLNAESTELEVCCDHKDFIILILTKILFLLAAASRGKNVPEAPWW